MKPNEPISVKLPLLEDEEWNELGLELLSLHFMDVVKRCFPQPFKNKDLAKVIGKSPSYVSQLCAGNRLLNLKTLHAVQLSQQISFDLVIRYDVGHPNFQQSTVISGSQFLCVAVQSNADASKEEILA